MTEIRKRVFLIKFADPVYTKEKFPWYFPNLYRQNLVFSPQPITSSATNPPTPRVQRPMAHLRSVRRRTEHDVACCTAALLRACGAGVLLPSAACRVLCSPSGASCWVLTASPCTSMVQARTLQGLRFRFWKKFRWPPETVYRPKFRGFPVISIGKSFQIQNSEISVYRPVFRCISPVFRCFSPKNDGNSWKMMGKLCICEKKLKILGSLP